MTDVARALGDLEGTVRSLQAQWQRQEDAAVAGRKVLYEKFEVMSAKMTRLEGQSETVQKNVADIKDDLEKKVMPTINAYILAQARMGGAIWAGKLFWAILIAGCTGFGFLIHSAFQHIGPYLKIVAP